MMGCQRTEADPGPAQKPRTVWQGTEVLYKVSPLHEHGRDTTATKSTEKRSHRELQSAKPSWKRRAFSKLQNQIRGYGNLSAGKMLTV